MKFDYYIILVSLCIYKSITSTRLNKSRTTFADVHLSLLRRDIGSLYHLCYLNAMHHHENDESHPLADKFLYFFHVASRLHSEVLIKPRTHATLLLHNPNGFWEDHSRFLFAHFSRQDGLDALKESDETLYKLIEWLMGSSVSREVVPYGFTEMMDKSITTIMKNFKSNKTVILNQDDPIAVARINCLVGLCRTESLVRRMITLNASGDYRERYDIAYLEEFDNKLGKNKAAIANKSDAAMLRYIMSDHHYESFMPYYLQYS